MNKKFIQIFALVSLMAFVLLSGVVLLITFNAMSKSIREVSDEIHVLYLSEIVGNYKNDLLAGNYRFFRNQISSLMDHKLFSEYELIEGGKTIDQSDNFGRSNGNPLFFKYTVPIYFDEGKTLKWGDVNLLVEDTWKTRFSDLAIGRVGSFGAFAAVFILLMSGVFLILSQKVNLSLHWGVEAIFSGINLNGNRIANIFWQPALDKIYNLKNANDRLAEQKAELQKKVVLGVIARQVAHDIRSPLSALNLITGSLREMPDESRLLIKSSLARINEIAADLLQIGRTQNYIKDSEFGGNEALSRSGAINIKSSICDIVNEKQIQFSKKNHFDFRIEIDEAEGVFVLGEEKEFKRALSNLLNNAFESLSNTGGLVSLCVRKYGEKVQIIVKDSGCGVPPEVLQQLGRNEISYGKEKGNGLGFLSSIKIINSINGRVIINSKIDFGTEVSLLLPILI